MPELNHEDVWNLFELYIQETLSDPSMSLPYEIKDTEGDLYIECTLPKAIQDRLDFDSWCGVITKVQCRVTTVIQDRSGIVTMLGSIKCFRENRCLTTIDGLIDNLYLSLRSTIGVKTEFMLMRDEVAKAFCAFINSIGGKISNDLPCSMFFDIEKNSTQFYVFNRAQIHNVCIDGDMSRTTHIRICGTQYYVNHPKHIAFLPTIFFVDNLGKETRPRVQGTTIKSMMWELSKVILPKKQHSDQSPQDVAVSDESKVKQELEKVMLMADELLRQLGSVPPPPH
jgi:hypothetical protein